MANRELPECIACGRKLNTDKQLEMVQATADQLMMSMEILMENTKNHLIILELVRMLGGMVRIPSSAREAIEKELDAIVKNQQIPDELGVSIVGEPAAIKILGDEVDLVITCDDRKDAKIITL